MGSELYKPGGLGYAGWAEQVRSPPRSVTAFLFRSSVRNVDLIPVSRCMCEGCHEEMPALRVHQELRVEEGTMEIAWGEKSSPGAIPEHPRGGSGCTEMN